MSSIDDDGAAEDIFEKYDPYIEKVRALFAPSLEPRIYSCLETFVYGNEEKGRSNEDGLERRLQMAETWRESSEAFRDNWANKGPRDNIFNQSIKYLIKDGLIDCFLNSIILNNRLNKISRDLDRLGIRRDFLRYLTAWNYINERDYWVESNEELSMPASNQPLDHQSDLEVEVGSQIVNDSRESKFNKPLKRRITAEDPLEDLEYMENIPEYVPENIPENVLDNLSTAPFEISGSIAPSIRTESSPDEKKKNKSISRCNSCRASTCSYYRSKSYSQHDWKGKKLKLKLCESSCDSVKNSKFTKLRLPCAIEDLMSVFLKNDQIPPDLYFKLRKKKFQAGVLSICRRINEIMKNLDKHEIRKCRLTGEILPGHLNFKITQREPNGCKVCLLNDRVPTKKIEINASKESLPGRLSQIVENENSRSTINKPLDINLNDDKIKLNDEIRGSIEQDYSKPNAITEETCICDDSPDHQNFPDEGGNETNNLADLPTEPDGKNSKQFIQEECSISIKDFTLEEDCTCNRFLNSSCQEENGKIDGEIKIEQKEDQLISENNPQIDSIAINPENPFCLCDKTLEKVVNPVEDSIAENSRASYEQSSQNPINKILENHACQCGFSESLNKLPNQFTEKVAEENSGNDLEVKNDEEKKKSISSETKEMKTKSKCKLRSDQSFFKLPMERDVVEVPSNSSSSKSLSETPDGSDEKIAQTCDCPSDCRCENKAIQDVASKYSHDSSHSNIQENKNSKNEEEAKPRISAGLDDLRGSPMRILTESFPEREEPTKRARKKNETITRERKKSGEEPPIISAKLGGINQHQRINISIELCSQSTESMEQMKKQQKNVANITIDKKIDRVNVSSEKRRCHSADRELAEKNVGTHLSVRGLEFREDSEQDASSLRNPNVCANPIKSGLRTAAKFERRSMSQAGKNLRPYEVGEFSRPMRNNAHEGRSKRGKSRRDETSPGASGGFSRSSIAGNIYQAFSASSVVRMRHLIKTKLRRILLERDKATNTSKMILTNKKYRFSVPNGKTDRVLLSQKCCRTIWESASDSNRTSRSFVSEDRNSICDAHEICHLFYNSPKVSTNSSSRYEHIFEASEYSTNGRRPVDSQKDFTNYERYGRNVEPIKNYPRLAGGSDNPARRKFDSQETLFSKNQEPFERVSNDDVQEIFRNDTKDFVSSGKLDSSLKSTSRHIYFHEFEEFDSDELSETYSWLKGENEKSKKAYPSEIQGGLEKKRSRVEAKVSCKRIHDPRPQKLKPKAEGNIRKNNEPEKTFNPTIKSDNLNRNGFSHLDYDLRSKLSQYVNLCKSVKYSLLKRIRPEISGVSISFDERCNF